MRNPLLYLAIIGATVALGACNDARSPTGSNGPQFSALGQRDSAGRDTTGLPSHYIASGATADVYWSGGGFDSLGGIGSGWTYGSVSVNRSGQVNDEWTSINWSISSCDASWNCRYSSGYGFVQAALLSGSGGADLRLAIDPSAYPGAFYIYGDTVGSIELTWHQAAGYSSRVSGNTEYTYPGYTYRSNGVTVTSTASVSGHVGSYALPAGASGSMGTSHAMTISFYH